MKVSDNTIEWNKIGSIQHFSFLSKDVICYATGCFLNFLNIHTRDEHKLDVNLPSVNGDGVGAVKGHRSLYVFCYAENRRHPTLYIKIYPAFQTLNIITDGPVEGYTAMAFSETSLLVTVSNLPDFILTIYNWRKGEKIGELHSKLNFEGQVIRASWSRPLYISQICKYHSKLLLWDIFTCCKTAVLAEHEIELPENEKHLKLLDTLWTTEGGLYVVDNRGHIYYMVNESYLEKVVEEDLEGDVPTSMCWYRAGIAVSGPNNEIRHYRKAGTWECDWRIQLEKGMKRLECNKAEYMIGLTVDEEIVKLSNTEEIVYLKRDENQFNDICLIYPEGDYFAALRINKYLNIYKTEDGSLINTMEFKHKALTVVENPEYPYVAVGYGNGVLELISLFNLEKMSVVTSFNLTGNPIGTIKFFEHGHIIVAGFLDIGEFFLIEGIPGTQMRIISNINVNQQIVDYMMVASKNCYRLFLIPVTTSNHLAGNKIIRYCIVDRDNITVKEYHLEDDKDFLYHRIVPTTKPDRDKIMYILPFNARSFHTLELRRGDHVMHLHAEIKTGHLLRKYELHLTKYYAVTWGYDGFIIVRSSNFKNEVAMALPHHRYLGGVKKAYIHPLGTFILSLGRDNVIACTTVTNNIVDSDRKYAIQEFMESTKLALMFKRPTIGFKPDRKSNEFKFIID